MRKRYTKNKELIRILIALNKHSIIDISTVQTMSQMALSFFSIISID